MNILIHQVMICFYFFCHKPEKVSWWFSRTWNRWSNHFFQTSQWLSTSFGRFLEGSLEISTRGIDVFIYTTFASSLVVFRSGPLHLPFELTVTVTHVFEELLTWVGLEFLDIFNFLPGRTPRFVVLSPAKRLSLWNFWKNPPIFAWWVFSPRTYLFLLTPIGLWDLMIS